ncbi:hypothetical protein [Microbulbifer sp. TYP-18]|uniref:hypothetical protein n=1 Tax=Microbulbifer sp. TYP-18 TaxID=3230024 RepID=UPI0034C60CFB
MRFIAVFLFLFSTAALASDVKLVCTISGKDFDEEKTVEKQVTLNDSEKKICVGYPCQLSGTYKLNETISYEGYKNWEVNNTVVSWSKEIIELKRRSRWTARYTLDRVSGVLKYRFDTDVNMKGPCKVVKKFKNEAQPRF